MTFDRNRESIELRYIKVSWLWGMSIFSLIIYTFFFQYSVKVIGGAMLILNALCIMLGLVCAATGSFAKRKTFYYLVIEFVAVSFLLSLIFGVSAEVSVSTGVRMIEYCMTGFSVYLYGISRRRRLRNVLFFTWLSILLLAVNVLLNGSVVEYRGAIGLGALNTNEMSSFFLLMVFCAFYLYGEVRDRLHRTLLHTSLLFVFFIQVQAASRRGFIVMVFMIVMNIIFAVIPYISRSHSRRQLAIYSLMIIGGGAALVVLREFIMNTTILGRRLAGSMTGGDAARARYQAFAFSQFLDRPLFGVGIGGIRYLLGVYSHSLFFEVISCTGFVGSVFLLAALISPFAELSSQLWERRNSVSFQNKNIYRSKVLLIYLLALAVSGYAVVMIYDFYFYLSLGLIAAGIKYAMDSETGRPE